MRWLLSFLMVLSLCLPGLAQDDHDHDHEHDHDHGSTPQVQSESGRAAQVGDTVEVYYIIRLKDQTILDATKKGHPFKFQVGQPGIIPGFSVAVVGMKPGEVRQRSIPPELGYGDSVEGIPADAELLCDLEMVSVQSPEELAAESKDVHDHSHSNLPAIMDFMIKDTFRRPWIADDQDNPHPTQSVLKSTAKIAGVALLLLIVGLFQKRMSPS